MSYQKIKTFVANLSLKGILLFIAIGIWLLVLQNAGIIPTSHRVEVINTVEVRGAVSTY